MVITSHFTPVVIRKNWYFLILCDYNTTPVLPFHPQILDRVHGPPIPPHPQVHYICKSTMSPTSTASASLLCPPHPPCPTCWLHPLCQPCRYCCLWDTTHKWLGRLQSKSRSGRQWHASASLTTTHIVTFCYGEFRLVCQMLTLKHWHWLGWNWSALCLRNITCKDSRHHSINLLHSFSGNRIKWWMGLHRG